MEEGVVLHGRRKEGGGGIALGPHHNRAPNWEREPKIERVLQIGRSIFEIEGPLQYLQA